MSVPMQMQQQTMMPQQPQHDGRSGTSGVDVPFLCQHNDWDNMRVKKGLMALRCRECYMQFKMPTDMIVKCFDFFHFTCCPAAGCPFLHIHKYKTKKKEQKHMLEAAIAAKAVIDKGVSLGAVGTILSNPLNQQHPQSLLIRTDVPVARQGSSLCISPGADVPQLALDFMDSPAVETPSGYGPLASSYLSKPKPLVPVVPLMPSPTNTFGVSLSPVVSPGPATGNPPTLLDSSMMESAQGGNKAFDPFSKDHLRSYLQRKPEVAASFKKEALEGLGESQGMQGGVSLPPHMVGMIAHSPTTGIQPLKSPSVAYSHNPYSPLGANPAPIDSPTGGDDSVDGDDDPSSPSKGPKIALQSMLEGLEPINARQVRVILPSGEVSAVTPESDDVNGSPLVYSCIKYSGKTDLNLSTLGMLLNLNFGEKLQGQGQSQEPDKTDKRKKGSGKGGKGSQSTSSGGYRGQVAMAPQLQIPQMMQQNGQMQQAMQQPPLIMPQIGVSANTHAPVYILSGNPMAFGQQATQMHAQLQMQRMGNYNATQQQLQQQQQYLQQAQQPHASHQYAIQPGLQAPFNIHGTTPLQMVYR
eukprot:TRINITY_DN7299_c0_g1_i2.p1 TRINITY_DN7299_c0_g1~~TRINITY_DN7299_c0_g1_i2.p1  ORF type:complete len:592 (+),score=97.26 TRINITY_DN7299_c0_g1_i2:31-1776(+)